jgi:hypothetical protein
MRATPSTMSIARFASSALLATVAAIALRGERPAQACSGGDWSGIEQITTFDPQIVGEWEGLAYNPYSSGFGGVCGDCLDKAMLADWAGYLGKDLKPDDWRKVLVGATEGELAGLRAKANNKAVAAPKGYESSTVFKAPKDRLLASLDFVKLVRRIEPFASFAIYDADGNDRKPTPPPADALTAARDGMKSKDPFLAQRYGFQALRVAFYQRDWPAVVALYDRNAAVFAGPSQDLAAQARHYVAGALMRKGNRARANLELARIAAEYPAIAGQAALGFEPAENSDWKDSLKLATTVRDKIVLWRMIGIKKDPIVAVQEILKLDPKSPLIALLLVRELTKAEGHVVDRFSWNMPEPKDIAAQRKEFSRIEQIALDQIAKNGDRPWLMELIAGHIAAKRGDLQIARARIQRAVAARPNDVKVASQARASLAVALALSWKLGDQAAETEIATAMAGIDKSFNRLQATRDEVRNKLAKVYLKAGKLAEAEWLEPGTVDPMSSSWGRPPVKRHWENVSFIRAMIARGQQKATPFDRFIVDGAFTQDQLQFELAMRLVFEGDFKGAQATMPKGKVKRFGVDPFVIHRRDCHECDLQKYAKAKWDHANLIARLIELDAKVKLGGETGADAAMQIGAVLYNMSWYGNATMVTDEVHQTARDTAPAIRYFKKAYELTTNKELKAKAAFFAAKSEIATLTAIEEEKPNPGNVEPISPTWYPVLKKLSTAKYYKEVIAECGRFAVWASK